MNVWVTFFYQSGQILFIDNGFSFGRVKAVDDVDLFIDCTKGSGGFSVLASEIVKLKPERVFATVSFESEWDIVRALADDRWIVGGPLASILSRFRNRFAGKLVATTLETFFGNQTSNVFDPYFAEFVRNAARFGGFRHFVGNCSIGKDCYWRKCSFCNYDEFEAATEPLNRGNAVEVLKFVPQVGSLGVESVFYHCGVLSATAKQLESMIHAEKGGNNFGLFVRADRGIVNKVCQFSDLSGITLQIGLESFCQEGMDRLNKGTTIQNGIDLIEAGLARGAGVSCLWIDRLPFMNESMVRESVDTIARIKGFVLSKPEYAKKFFFFTNPFLSWPTKEKAGMYGDYFSLGSVIGGFVNRLSFEQEMLNKKINDAVYNSGVRVLGT